MRRSRRVPALDDLHLHVRARRVSGTSPATCCSSGCSGRGSSGRGGRARFVRYYLICGLGGMLAHLLLAHESTLVGASAAIYGVMLAYAVRWPDNEFLLWFVVPVRAKWLVAGVCADRSRVRSVDARWWVVGRRPLRASGRDRNRLALSAYAAGERTRTPPPAGLLGAPDVPDEPPRPIPRGLPRQPRRGARSTRSWRRARRLSRSVRPAQAPRTSPGRGAATRSTRCSTRSRNSGSTV